MEPNNNSISNRMKMIDRIITAYKAKKLLLQAQQVKQNGIKEEEEKSYKSMRNRMNNAYKKMKRRKKIQKLMSNSKHWKGLS